MGKGSKAYTQRFGNTNTNGDMLVIKSQDQPSHVFSYVWKMSYFELVFHNMHCKEMLQACDSWLALI